MDPRRTSPAAKTPGTLVSRANGARSRGGSSVALAMSGPVTTKPWPSRATESPSQSVRGLAPMKTKSQPAATSSVVPESRSDRVSASRCPSPWRADDLGAGAHLDGGRAEDAVDEVLRHGRLEARAADQQHHPLGEQGEPEGGLAG